MNAVLGQAEDLGFAAEFNAVFSNAALHWVQDQRSILNGVCRALRVGGRFVAEMGGHGNIAAIRVALQAVLRPLVIDEDAGHNFFPAASAYRAHA